MSRGLPAEELDNLIGARDYRLFPNPKNEMYRARNMQENSPPRGEALRLMAENPHPIERPILGKGRRAVLGFEPEQTEKVA